MARHTSLTVSHRGPTFELGHDDGEFVILHINPHGKPSVVQSFPQTEEGWVDAWHAFTKVEPHAEKLKKNEAKDIVPEPPVPFLSQPAPSLPKSIHPHRHLLWQGSLYFGIAAAMIAITGTLIRAIGYSAGVGDFTGMTLFLMIGTTIAAGLMFFGIGFSIHGFASRNWFPFALVGGSSLFLGSAYFIFAGIGTAFGGSTGAGELFRIISNVFLLFAGFGIIAALFVLWQHRELRKLHTGLVTTLVGIIPFEIGLLVSMGSAPLAGSSSAPFLSGFTDILYCVSFLMIAIGIVLLSRHLPSEFAGGVGFIGGLGMALMCAAALLGAIDAFQQSTSLVIAQEFVEVSVPSMALIGLVAIMVGFRGHAEQTLDLR